MNFDHVSFTFCLSHISLKLPKQNIVYMGWDLARCLGLRVACFSLPLFFSCSRDLISFIKREGIKRVARVKNKD